MQICFIAGTAIGPRKAAALKMRQVQVLKVMSTSPDSRA